MTVQMVRDVLLWCSIMNVGILLLWVLFILLAHELAYQSHGKWFRLSAERFAEIHYSGMGFYKICIVVFNIVPYVALRMAG